MIFRVKKFHNGQWVIVCPFVPLPFGLLQRLTSVFSGHHGYIQVIAGTWIGISNIRAGNIDIQFGNSIDDDLMIEDLANSKLMQAIHQSIHEERQVVLTDDEMED
jgi:hypothetical protein